jgi:hypothetical protein
MNDWVAVARRGVSTSKALRNTIMKEGKVAIAKTNKLDSRACDTDTLNHQRASSHKSLRIRSNSHERWKECSTIRPRGSLCQLERPTASCHGNPSFARLLFPHPPPFIVQLHHLVHREN